MMNHQRQPSYAECVREVARLRRVAGEELGLPADHQIMRHLDHLEKDWGPLLLYQVRRCIERLQAERAKLDRIADRIPPAGVFNGTDLLVGECTTPHGAATHVFLDPNTFVTHWLIAGTPGSGKTTLVRLLLAELVLQRPWVTILLFDPNRSYEALCREHRIWVSLPFYETRMNVFCPPPGYPFGTWVCQKLDALGRNELRNSIYLITRRLDKRLAADGLPERDDGRCLPSSLINLRDDLDMHREKPGSRDEAYRAAALNVIDGRIRTTGSSVYDCARGMEDLLTRSRVRLDVQGLSPPESAEFYQTNFIQYLYCRRSLEPLVEPPVLEALTVVEEAQVLLGKYAHANIASYQEILLKSRSLGMGFIFVAQDLQDIDPRVLSAIGNFAVFRQSSAVNKRLARDLLDLSPRETELLGRLETGECFVKMGGHPRWPFPFLMRVTP